MIGGALTASDVGKQVTFANGAKARVVRRNKKDGSGSYYNYKIVSGAPKSYLSGIRGTGKTLSAQKAAKAFARSSKHRSRRSALADKRHSKSGRSLISGPQDPRGYLYAKKGGPARYDYAGVDTGKEWKPIHTARRSMSPIAMKARMRALRELRGRK